MSQEKTDEMNQTIIKNAEELVKAMSENKELFESLKDVEQDVEIIRLISKELEAVHEIMTKQKYTAEEIADEVAGIRYTARLDITLDRKEVSLFMPSGTLIFRAPVEDAKNMTLEQILVKAFSDVNVINRLYQNLIERLNLVTKAMMGKYDIVEKINYIADWLDKNDP